MLSSTVTALFQGLNLQEGGNEPSVSSSAIDDFDFAEVELEYEEEQELEFSITEAHPRVHVTTNHKILSADTLISKQITHILFVKAPHSESVRVLDLPLETHTIYLREPDTHAGMSADPLFVYLWCANDWVRRAGGLHISSPHPSNTSLTPSTAPSNNGTDSPMVNL